jgi:hypothetical protein
MRKKLLVLLLFGFMGLTGCDVKNKNFADNPLTINGTWVEITKKSDTIDFTEFGSKPALNLRRGLVLINGYQIPDYGSGFYAYEILKSDSIGLCYVLSSSCVNTVPISYSKYFFKLIDRNTFIICNFYNPGLSPDTIFTFSRIE